MLQIDLNNILRNRIPSLYNKKISLPGKAVESVLSGIMKVKKIKNSPKIQLSSTGALWRQMSTVFDLGEVEL